MADLKPCPFCGSEAEWDEKNKALRCSQCEATNFVSCVYMED